MNILWSLILYNPLEALTLILFCDMISKRKFRFFDVLHCYILGTINLLFQISRMLFDNKIIILFLDLFVALVIMTITLNLYYNKQILSKSECEKTTLKHSFCAIALNYVSIMISTFVLNSLFGKIYDSNYTTSYYEFISNIFIRLIFLLIVGFISDWRLKYEKRTKEDCN